MATTLVPHLARRTLTLTHALGPTDRERPGRRLLNISVAAVGLVLALPLMLLIGLLIKLTSRGPVLFKQTRVGLDRRSPPRPGGGDQGPTHYRGRTPMPEPTPQSSIARATAHMSTAAYAESPR